MAEISADISILASIEGKIKPEHEIIGNVSADYDESDQDAEIVENLEDVIIGSRGLIGGAILI